MPTSCDDRPHGRTDFGLHQEGARDRRESIWCVKIQLNAGVLLFHNEDVLRFLPRMTLTSFWLKSAFAQGGGNFGYGVIIGCSLDKDPLLQKQEVYRRRKGITWPRLMTFKRRKSRNGCAPLAESVMGLNATHVGQVVSWNHPRLSRFRILPTFNLYPSRATPARMLHF